MDNKYGFQATCGKEYSFNRQQWIDEGIRLGMQEDFLEILPNHILVQRVSKLIAEENQ